MSVGPSIIFILMFTSFTCRRIWRKAGQPLLFLPAMSYHGSKSPP